MSLRSWLAWLGFTLLLGAWFVLAYYSLTLGVDWAAYLFPEDHFFENLGAVSLFLASLISLFVFWRAVRQGSGRVHPLRSALYLGMALLFFFVGGEEISWGQRIFHIPEPPALAAQSPQQDLTLHGLTAVEIQSPAQRRSPL